MAAEFFFVSFRRNGNHPGLAERFVKLDEALRSKDLLLEETWIHWSQPKKKTQKQLNRKRFGFPKKHGAFWGDISFYMLICFQHVLIWGSVVFAGCSVTWIRYGVIRVSSPVCSSHRYFKENSTESNIHVFKWNWHWLLRFMKKIAISKVIEPQRIKHVCATYLLTKIRHLLQLELKPPD